MLGLFTLTVFVSAALLFLVQPMFARFALPLLGGSPAVWNTALVFYQLVLLAGYAYSHLVSSRLAPRRQAILHGLLVLAAFASLPIALPRGWSPPVAHDPVVWMLGLLAVGVGLPFFVVSTTGPLVQKWLSATPHPSARDPYFLYAASNAGSLIGLLAYPALLEPYLRLGEQSRIWTAGYALLAALLLACSVVVARVARGGSRGEPGLPHDPDTAGDASANPADEPPIPLRRRLRWLLLAFVPSSLMLGVTTHITTDVAAIPLLWVLPLALYLSSFILVFARRPLVPHALVARALPVVVVPLVIVMASGALQPIRPIIGMHLLLLWVAAMACHGELARDRPSAGRLTEFYLWLALGGALGGVFNALIAPTVFRSVAEYPIAIVLACLVTPPPRPLTPDPRARALDVVVPILFGGIVVAAPAVAGALGRDFDASAGVLLIAALALPLYACARRPARFALGLGAILLADPGGLAARSRTLEQERSFFGVYRVRLDASGRFLDLVHGTTLHGSQRIAPRTCDEPLVYYHRNGPAGDIFCALDNGASGSVVAGDGAPALRSVAIVGLGTGALAAYARPGQQWAFFEIDPVVERIASDTSYFCFLSACRGEHRVVLGDARRSLAALKDRYDLIVLDAYTSDAIPVHLITLDALRLYLEHLAPHGVIAFHLSNRYFDLVPVVARLAEAQGLVCRVRAVASISLKEVNEQRIARATYAVMARSLDDLRGLAADSSWTTPRPRPGRVWTDDYSSLITVLKPRAGR